MPFVFFHFLLTAQRVYLFSRFSRVSVCVSVCHETGKPDSARGEKPRDRELESKQKRNQYGRMQKRRINFMLYASGSHLENCIETAAHVTYLTTHKMPLILGFDTLKWAYNCYLHYLVALMNLAERKFVWVGAWTASFSVRCGPSDRVGIHER